MKTLSFGSKDFLQGISPLQQQQNSVGGFFAKASGIDLYRNLGKISPGIKPTSVADLARTNVKCITTANSKIYAHTTSELINVTDDVVHTFTTLRNNISAPTATYAHSVFVDSLAFPNYFSDGTPIPNTTQSKKCIIYFTDTHLGFYNIDPITIPTGTGSTTTVSSMFFDTLNTNINQLPTSPLKAFDFVGYESQWKGTWSSSTSYTSGQKVLYNNHTYQAQANSTNVTPGTNPSIWYLDDNTGLNTFRPANFNLLNPGPHKAVLFDKKYFFTNGIYVSWFDPHGELFTIPFGKFSANSDSIYAPNDYIFYDIVPDRNRLLCFASNGYKTVMMPWDGKSATPDETTYIDDANISAAGILNGIPHILTTGKSTGHSLRKRNYAGYSQVNLITEVSTANHSCLDSLNTMAVLTGTNTNKVFTYGSPIQNDTRTADGVPQFPDALHCPYITTGSTNISLLTTDNKLYTASNFNDDTTKIESFTLSPTTSTNYNKNSTFQTNFFQLPDDSTIEFIRFVILPPATGAAFTPTLYTDFSTSAVWTGADLTASNLDANGKSKTYYDIGSICDNFAIGGSWANSSDTYPANSIIITRIDVGYHSKS